MLTKRHKQTITLPRHASSNRRCTPLAFILSLPFNPSSPSSLSSSHPLLLGSDNYSPSLFPILATSHSIITVSPTGTGFRYVTFSVLLTPAYSQNPFLLIGKRAVVVVKSKMVAVQPPCRLLRRLVCVWWQVYSYTTLPVGRSVAEMILRPVEQRFSDQPWEC